MTCLICKTPRKMRKIIFVTLMCFSAMIADAQHGLAVNNVFEGRIVPLEKMVETRVRGKDIAKYQLSYFRSLRFEATVAQTDEIFALVEKDVHEELIRSGGKGSKTTRTLMVRLRPAGKANRFVCVKSRNLFDKHNEVILIYMEGALNSLEKLGEILKN